MPLVTRSVILERSCSRKDPDDPPHRHAAPQPRPDADEFQTHWRDVHAAKIVSVPGIREWLVRYEQHPRLPAQGAWTGTEGFDGMTMQWYRASTTSWP